MLRRQTHVLNGNNPANPTSPAPHTSTGSPAPVWPDVTERPHHSHPLHRGKTKHCHGSHFWHPRRASSRPVERR
jgi:hypothetical protein